MIVELTRIRENVDLDEGRPAQNKSELIQALAKETPPFSSSRTNRPCMFRSAKFSDLGYE